jgi:hypothetical protein
MSKKIHKSSFRDPSGFLFFEDGKLLRQVNESYHQDYDFLMGCGLYDKLIKAGLLIPHLEIDGHPGINNYAFKIIEPEKINFISYPSAS